MNYADKSLKCRECGKAFIFSGEEQVFYAKKEFKHEPSRCRECREKKRGGGGTRSEETKEKKMFKTICTDCEAETTVPFQPEEGRPVYCRDCYQARKLKGEPEKEMQRPKDDGTHGYR